MLNRSATIQDKDSAKQSCAQSVIQDSVYWASVSATTLDWCTFPGYQVGQK